MCAELVAGTDSHGHDVPLGVRTRKAAVNDVSGSSTAFSISTPAKLTSSCRRGGAAQRTCAEHTDRLRARHVGTPELRLAEHHGLGATLLPAC